MSKIFKPVIRVFKGAVIAFKRYPASIGFAIAFSIITLIRIQLEWPQQEPYNFLLNCLHWSFALGAIVSLSATSFAVSRYGSKKEFISANLFGIISTAAAFLLLFFFARTNIPDYQHQPIANVAQIRIIVLIFVSLVIFLLFAGYKDKQIELDLSLFMTMKAFFIALIYGLVIFAGASGVASAVEYLVYSNLSEKVFMYLGTLSGLVGYMLFIGYFPDFTKGSNDPKRSSAQKQPRFIEVLFSYIMIPIVLALTLVLLIWTIRTVISGMQVRLIQLYSIAAAYTLGGLWLHAMTLRSESSLSKIYRIVYPIASLIILIFEGWAVASQLLNAGLKLTEYIFIVLGMLALTGAILLLIKRKKAHVIIALAACLLAVLAVLPGIGYKALPIKAQSTRLEKLLASQDMLAEDTISPAKTEPDEKDRIAITDAVYYLMNEREAKLPVWFDADEINEKTFKDVFGFEQAWPKLEDLELGYAEDGSIRMALGATVIPVSDYDWIVEFQGHMYNQPPVVFTGNKGEYTIFLDRKSESDPPEISISIDGDIVIEQSLKSYFDDLTNEYGLVTDNEITGSLNDMSIKYETDQFYAMLVFDYVEFFYNASDDEVYYWVEPDALYIKEK